MTPGAFPINTSPLSAFSVHGTGSVAVPDPTPSAPVPQEMVVDFTANDAQALGVRMKVSTGGTVGRISITNVVTTLTTGLVLSQAVGVFVQVCSCPRASRARTSDACVPCCRRCV